MSASLRHVIAQLGNELGDRANAWAALTGDIEFERRIAQRVPFIAEQLAHTDDRLAAQTVIDVLNVLWSTEPPNEWWHTPLGALCARSLGHHDTETVSRSVAAAMLGVTTGTIGKLLERGNLDRHPDGGILRSSVMQRLARLHGPPNDNT